MITSGRAATIYLNGKWLAHPVTGTERYASEVLRRWAAAPPAGLVLVVPADATVPDWAASLPCIRSRARGAVFEQLVLPLRTARRMLVSLAGPAPLLKRRQLVVIHDASVFAVPETYSPRFATAYRLLYRTVARTARRVVTVSRFSAGELAHHLRLPVDRFTVVPGGWEHMSGLPVRAPERSVPEGPFALFLGTPARHKNLRPTLTAFQEAGIDCVVVGPIARARVFDAVGDGAGDRVRMTGRVSDDELRWLLQRADALVFPSLYEGFGLPLLEAQSQGCPVISSNAAAMPEVAGQGARFFDPRRTGEAVAAFAELQDGEARRRLVEAGRRNLARYSWGDSAAALWDLASRNGSSEKR